MAALSWRKNKSETIPGTMLYQIALVKLHCHNIECRTSPAAAAKPEMHLAASSDVNVLAVAVQHKTLNIKAIETIRAALFPNFAATGTQKRFPSPRSKKLNCEVSRYCSKGTDHTHSENAIHITG